MGFLNQYLTGTLCACRFREEMNFGVALTKLRRVLHDLGWKHLTIGDNKNQLLRYSRKHSSARTATIDGPDSWLLYVHYLENNYDPLQEYLLHSGHIPGGGDKMMLSENYMVPHDIMISLPLAGSSKAGSSNWGPKSWYGCGDFYSEKSSASISCRFSRRCPAPDRNPFWNIIQSQADGLKKAKREGWVEYNTYQTIGTVSAEGLMGGFTIDLLPDVCPPLMEHDKLPGSLEAYHLMRTLVETFDLTECLGVHQHEEPPDRHYIDWKHETAWSQDTLFRFGPGIPNRLIIPLEERRMPTAEEMQDERLDGSAIWSKDL